MGAFRSTGCTALFERAAAVGSLASLLATACTVDVPEEGRLGLSGAGTSGSAPGDDGQSLTTGISASGGETTTTGGATTEVGEVGGSDGSGEPGVSASTSAGLDDGAAASTGSLDGSGGGDDNAATPCAPGQYTCGDSQCVAVTDLCNGVSNCGDGSDEYPMNPTCAAPGCALFDFTCSNGDCVSLFFLCDGVVDCADASDESEAECGSSYCFDDEFTCNDGGCIPFEWLCDGYLDCDDDSDEYPVNQSC